jgi:hypothetical protein
MLATSTVTIYFHISYFILILYRLDCEIQCVIFILTQVLMCTVMFSILHLKSVVIFHFIYVYTHTNIFLLPFYYNFLVLSLGFNCT